MRGILSKILKGGRTTQPAEPSKDSTKELENAQQEARATQLRKELLDREVRATIARLNK